MTNLQRPTTDFFAVRDGRRSPWYSHEVDLSTARTDTPSGDLILQIAGNSFYIDRAPDVGNASIQFQDTSFDRAMLPIYAGPGFIANAPFTQIKITNIAQPGKVLRIFYGVDIDFQPGTSSEIVLTGVVNTNAVISGVVQTNDISLNKPKIKDYTGVLAFNANSFPAINGFTNFMLPGSNVNGTTILDAFFKLNDPGNTNNTHYFIAAPSMPLFIGSGYVFLVAEETSAGNYNAKLSSPIYLPPGMGVFLYSAQSSIINLLISMTIKRGPLT